jgi:deoxyribodipyrimidine photo-lyase
MKLAVVWYKRDLRVFDHAPLVEAAKHRQVLPLYIYDPALIRAPDCSAQQVHFINECLSDLDQALSARGSPLLAQHGDSVMIFQRLLDTFGPFTLLARRDRQQPEL